MKIIIAGGRDFDNYELLFKRCNIILFNVSDIEIVSGKTKGADTLGEKYAKERNFPIKEFPANWKLYGKKAGPLRNEEMAIYADALIAFWDSKSTGTANMINLAEQHNLLIRIIRY